MSTKKYPLQRNAASEGTLRLNVIIHGLWAIETNQEGIRLTTPGLPDHVIKAGRVREPNIDLRTVGNKSFRLSGVVRGKKSDFLKDLTFQVPFQGRSNVADLNKMALEILLPYPAEINSVRTFETDGQPFFKNDFPKTPPNRAAVVQVLVYD